MPASFGSRFFQNILGTTTCVVNAGLYTEPGGTPTIALATTIANAATVVGNLNALPTKNLSNTYWYYLVPGADDTNNDLFTITQKSGVTLAHIDFATASVEGVKKCRIAAEDQNGLVTEFVLTITVSAP